MNKMENHQNQTQTQQSNFNLQNIELADNFARIKQDSNCLKKREEFAVSLRKKKRQDNILKKRIQNNFFQKCQKENQITQNNQTSVVDIQCIEEHVDQQTLKSLNNLIKNFYINASNSQYSKNKSYLMDKQYQIEDQIENCGINLQKCNFKKWLQSIDQLLREENEQNKLVNLIYESVQAIADSQFKLKDQILSHLCIHTNILEYLAVFLLNQNVEPSNADFFISSNQNVFPNFQTVQIALIIIINFANIKCNLISQRLCGINIDSNQFQFQQNQKNLLQVLSFLQLSVAQIYEKLNQEIHLSNSNQNSETQINQNYLQMDILQAIEIQSLILTIFSFIAQEKDIIFIQEIVNQSFLLQYLKNFVSNSYNKVLIIDTKISKQVLNLIQIIFSVLNQEYFADNKQISQTTNHKEFFNQEFIKLVIDCLYGLCFNNFKESNLEKPTLAPQNLNLSLSIFLGITVFYKHLMIDNKDYKDHFNEIIIQNLHQISNHMLSTVAIGQKMIADEQERIDFYQAFEGVTDQDEDCDRIKQYEEEKIILISLDYIINIFAIILDTENSLILKQIFQTITQIPQIINSILKIQFDSYLMLKKYKVHDDQLTNGQIQDEINEREQSIKKNLFFISNIFGQFDPQFVVQSNFLKMYSIFSESNSLKVNGFQNFIQNVFYLQEIEINNQQNLRLMAEASICLSNFITCCPDEFLEFKILETQNCICNQYQEIFEIFSDNILKNWQDLIHIQQGIHAIKESLEAIEKIFQIVKEEFSAEIPVMDHENNEKYLQRVNIMQLLKHKDGVIYINQIQQSGIQQNQKWIDIQNQCYQILNTYYSGYEEEEFADGVNTELCDSDFNKTPNHSQFNI